MRTTITLDPDAHALVARAMEERGLTFKEAVNDAIRAGLGTGRTPAGGYTRPRALGPARVDVTKALALAAGLEDDALAARLSTGR